MMKKLLVLMLVLAMTSAANAALLISVDGVVNPPDTEVWLDLSEIAIIDVYSDGLTLSNQEFYLQIEGGGAMDITKATNTVNPPGYPSTVIPLSDTLAFLDLALAGIPIPVVPEGTVVDLIEVHCVERGVDVVLTLYSNVDGVLDTQIIHQIPEPATIALLGLGGLALLRRRR
jgi:hypothetical protein